MRKNILAAINPHIGPTDVVTLIAPSQSSADKSKKYIKASTVAIDPKLVFEYGVPPMGMPFCFWVKDGVVERRIP